MVVDSLLNSTRLFFPQSPTTPPSFETILRRRQLLLVAVQHRRLRPSKHITEDEAAALMAAVTEGLFIPSFKFSMVDNSIFRSGSLIVEQLLFQSVRLRSSSLVCCCRHLFVVAGTGYFHTCQFCELQAVNFLQTCKQHTDPMQVCGIYVTDESYETPLLNSAWRDLATTLYDALKNKGRMNNVISLSDLKSSTFGGFSLGSTMSTIFDLNPQGDRASILKKWLYFPFKIRDNAGSLRLNAFNHQVETLFRVKTDELFSKTEAERLEHIETEKSRLCSVDTTLLISPVPNILTEHNMVKWALKAIVE